MICVFDNLGRKQADTFHLVILSQGIACRVTRENGHFRVYVPESQRDAARHAVAVYFSENPCTSADDDGDAGAHFPSSPANLSGVVVALMMMTVYAAMATSGDFSAYVMVFGAKARMIMAGEGYRCVTALLLHADAAHLAGNMAGLALFGGVVCTMTGTGVGWLMILAGGAAGNAINAMTYAYGANRLLAEHLSIGASTAVFAALGILSAIRSVESVRIGNAWRKVAIYLGAGAALLGFMGTSARSDISAHLFGFLAGAAMGAVYALCFRRPLGRWIQLLASGTAVMALLLSWMVGASRQM